MTSKGSRFVESAGYKLAAVALLAVVGGNPKHIQMQPPIGRTPTQSRQQNTIRRVHRKTDGFISGLCAICANAFQKLCFKGRWSLESELPWWGLEALGSMSRTF